MERDVGCMVVSVVVAGDWEFGSCVARGSEVLGITRGMLEDSLQPLNNRCTMQLYCDRW